MSNQAEVKMVLGQLPEYVQCTIQFITSYAELTKRDDARVACRDILEYMRIKAEKLADENRIAVEEVTLPPIEPKDVKDLGVF